MTGPQTVVCAGLTKSFGGVKALRGVSLRFPESGIVAMVGPNGAGKTTLVNVVTGFLRPDDGSVTIGGRGIEGMPVWRIARLGVGRTFQDLRLVREATVLENVMLARPNQSGERLFRALTGVGVAAEEEANKSVSSGLLRVVGLGGREKELARDLSYGQQKLLSLGRCLATEARMLFLDEPVAGVDEAMVEQIAELLVTLKGDGLLVVFIEHDLAVVRRIADEVIVMDQGCVVAQGSPADVLVRAEIVETFVG